ncbi:MAG: GNAT family N-acetyltransferase [Bacteroidia bacterium]
MEIETGLLKIREAKVRDITKIMEVRFSVKENVLSNPALVTEKENIEYLTVRGKGWVCEINTNIVGFAIADLKDHSIWALFVKPEYERKGIGKNLHDTMLDWYFNQSNAKVWLGTAANTRAEIFYKASGWVEISRKEKAASSPSSLPWTEIKFEMTFADWKKTKSSYKSL